MNTKHAILRLRQVIRRQHKALSTESCYVYWLGRYIERAENTARMLDVNYQTSLLPQSADMAEQAAEYREALLDLFGHQT